MDERPGELHITAMLLRQFLAGDHHAERRLFEVHRAMLVRRAENHRLMHFLAKYTTAEDAVDEVFVRAIASRLFDTFEDRGPGSLGGALGRVLEFVLLDACRRYGARGANVKHLGCDEGVMDSLASADPSPTGNVRFEEFRALCQRCLEPREWDAWRLSVIEGLDNASIGERMGVSASAVRGLLHRAKPKLARLLADARES